MLNIRLVYKRSFIVFICMFFTVVLIEKNAYAEKNKIFSNTGLELPRFVSIAKNTANVRSGPGQKYPVKWTINRKELPVEVILEFDHWRKIRDHEGAEGWVFHTLLSGKRYAVIIGSGNATAYDTPNVGGREKSNVSMYLEPRSIVRLVSCKSDWCEVETADLSGWIKRKSLWGVYETENID